jgi:hypothetical protein
VAEELGPFSLSPGSCAVPTGDGRRFALRSHMGAPGACAGNLKCIFYFFSTQKRHESLSNPFFASDRAQESLA